MLYNRGGMINLIENEVEGLKLEKFSGIIKFGIEHGKIVSIVISSSKVLNKTEIDYHRSLNILLDDILFFGQIEIELYFGKVVDFRYSQTFKGDELKRKLAKQITEYSNVSMQ